MAGLALMLERLEHGDNGALVGLIHKGLDLVALEGLHQSLDGGIVLVALLDGQHVDVSLGGLAVGGLNGQSVGNLQAGVDGIVAVDDGHIHIAQTDGQLAGFQLHDVQILGVLGDVGLGGGDAGTLLQGDQALLLEQEQGAGLVGGVVGHGDLSAVSQLVDAGGLAGIQAEGLVVNLSGADQVGAVADVELVHVGDVLEVVGVQLTALHRQVGLDVVVELHDLQGDALLSQDALGYLQDLSVGGGSGADLNGGALQRGGVLHSGGLGVAGGGLGITGGGVGGAGVAAAAAGQQAERQSAGQEQRDKLLHGTFLLFILTGVTQIRVQKNALEECSRTRAFRFVVPPCFTSASRQGPYGVQSYSCALTGAPVAAYTKR